ncbi:aspartate/glutamate racemase family protein [Clostridiales bacterium TF09-2AC]|uniref:Aspartate/glutamate racemase family protein n=1 Tax=Enterocloster hominis (ex Hitch et al. 2024) TaxID=1917870 RepID=A0ABV1D517_9FIRM|nr:aspartate/glutamate racemase family protein [Lachnoclostridium pacaense]EEQ59301.1 aspartate racemase [Clostridiales bacterium 1_7_47FAA]MCC2820093.1 aspartate/glutamate racemase family protein [Lachnoclostridium pacaense]MCD8168469.1 aspartate/glutamate racemase family protein [Clostridiales bacterium]RJW36518.1 aspartate/glutamate racemase family protein [Clostridiales bacterium TF09-2AC]
MKTIGLIGGMSWESTVTYYQIINETVKKELGGLHSSRCILYSVDFDEIEKCQSCGDWDKSGDILGQAARSLEKAGADFIVICTNTMHKVAPRIQSYISIPLLHIADVTTECLKDRGIKTVALLGTRYTMEQDFYKERLVQSGLQVLIPEEPQREMINRVIFDELCLGTISPESRAGFLAIIRGLGQKGAEGVILGCTEIGLLIRQEDTDIPLFDTTVIHARKAAMASISGHVTE